MDPLNLTLAIAPAAAVIWYVYSRDRHESEPHKMLGLAFLFGIMSVVPAMLGSMMGGQFFFLSDNMLMTALYAFIVVGLSEEFAKFIFLRFILFHKKDFNEPYDGIIYAVMIGMGFATFENILYVSDGGLDVAILRMFTAVPAHAAFGVVMGYWVGLAKFDPVNRNRYLWRGLFAAVILHGAYDFFIMQNNFPALSGITFILLYMAVKWSRNAIKMHAKRSPFKNDDYDILQ